ncbi:MAG: N-acetylmuramoyl-L-alanine amidase [Clostridium sp.]
MKRIFSLIIAVILLVSCGVKSEETTVKKPNKQEGQGDSQSITDIKDGKFLETYNSNYIICIDPGHQEKPMLDKEPVYPGASIKKYKVSPGATGVSTGVHEYELTLQVSLKLRDMLIDRGYNVVMTRETNNVSISNMDRAYIGNNANADLVVRVHADSNPSSSVEGSTILYPVGEHTAAISDKSLVAATIMEKEYAKATGAKSRGLMPRSDMTGFNHSTVPTIIVEMGFMSNPSEDKLMSTPEYQAKIVNGIYGGIEKYCETINKENEKN